MGQYLLGGMIAKIPYTAKELEIHIYTAEELCYYIYHNLSVLADDFIQDDLVEFIRGQLKMSGLADRISRYYQSKKDRDMILVLILRDIGYYNEVEISEFQEHVSALRRMNPLERQKDRADLFVSKSYYRKAIEIYQQILNTSRDLRLRSGFYSRVYQHMAVCYANLFQYEQAMKSLQKAYREEKSEEIQKQIYFVSRLQGKIIPKELQDVGEAAFQKWEREFSDVEKRCRMEANSGSIAAMNGKEDLEREEALKKYVENKKQEYREMATYVSI